MCEEHMGWTVNPDLHCEKRGTNKLSTRANVMRKSSTHWRLVIRLWKSSHRKKLQQESPPAWTQEAYRPPHSHSKSLLFRGGGGSLDKKNFSGLNMYQAKSGVKNFSLGGRGGSLNKKIFPGLNMYQAKSGVKNLSLYWDWVPPLDLDLGLPPTWTWDPPDLRPGTPQPWLGPGTLLPGPGTPPDLRPGTPPPPPWPGTPLPGPGTPPPRVWTEKLKTVPSPFLWMRAVTTT